MFLNIGLITSPISLLIVLCLGCYIKITEHGSVSAMWRVSSWKQPDDVAGSIQEIILKELRVYFFAGGMPECVKTYHDSGSMVETCQVQSEILDSYRDDFSKYTPHSNTICLDAIFLGVAKSSGEQLKYTRLNDRHSSQVNRKAFDLLARRRSFHYIVSRRLATDDRTWFEQGKTGRGPEERTKDLQQIATNPLSLWYARQDSNLRPTD